MRRNSRTRRDLVLSWSAILGGALPGAALCATLLLLGTALGLRLQVSGVCAAALSALPAGFLTVRLAGDRRRAHALAHAAIGWALSLLAFGLVALFAPWSVRAPAATLALSALLASLLSLGASLVGALLASARESGLPVFRSRSPVRDPVPMRADTSVLRDQTTILPPIH